MSLSGNLQISMDEEQYRLHKLGVNKDIQGGLHQPDTLPATRKHSDNHKVDSGGYTINKRESQGSTDMLLM